MMPLPAELPVLFLGCGDLGTGAAHRLFRAGFPVAALELPVPLAVRRRVAFAEAARSGEVEVEGVCCRRLVLDDFASGGWRRDCIALFVESAPRVLEVLRSPIVVDARLAKRVSGPRLPAGTFHVVLGPGYVAGKDCDAVVETWRGPRLGDVIWAGEAEPDTGRPAELGGASFERLLRAPAAGRLQLQQNLGAPVRAGEIVATVAGVPVRAALAGILRGLLSDGDEVQVGQKLGDIDPRPDAPPLDRISDKAHAVGQGVLRAIRERFRIEADLPE